MSRDKWLVIIGSVLIIASVFLPFMHDDSEYSDGESATFIDIYKDNGISFDGPGIPIIILAGIAVMVILIDRIEYLLIPATLLSVWGLSQFKGTWIAYRANIGLELGIAWAFWGAGFGMLTAPLGLACGTALTLDPPSQLPEEDEISSVSLLGSTVPDNFKARAFNVSPQQLMILAGFVIIILGHFVPTLGGMSGNRYYGEGDSTGSSLFVLLLVTIIAFMFVALRKYDAIWVMGLTLLLMLVNTLRVNLASEAVNWSNLRLGWLLLFNGAVLWCISFLLSPDREHVSALIHEFFAPEWDDEDEEVLDPENPDESDADML